MMIFIFVREENIVGKEEKAGYQHFLLFSYFQKASSSGLLILHVSGSWITRAAENFMSNFSLSYSVFKSLVMQACKNQGLFGKGLTLSQTSPGF